jgi:hypothetical protein
VTVKVVTLVLGLLVAGTAGSSAATAVARLAYVDEAATIQRASRPTPAHRGALLYHADHVWTTTGRAEITFTDGSMLHVDRESHVIVYDGERFAVIDGRVVFRSAAAAGPGYLAQIEGVQIRTSPLGVIGILVNERGRQVLVNVEAGEAVVENRAGRTRLISRQATLISADTGRPYVMQSSRQIDTFDRWSSARVQANVPSHAKAEDEPMHYGEDERMVDPAFGYYNSPIWIVTQPHRFYGNGSFRRPGFHHGRGDGGKGGGRGDRAPAPAPAAAQAPPSRPPLQPAAAPKPASAGWGRAPR